MLRSFLLQSEEFVVCSESFEPDDASSVVNPDEQEVILYVTPHTPLVDAMQLVWLVFGGYTSCIFEMSDDGEEILHLSSVVLVSLTVLSELGGVDYLVFHSSNDLMNAS